MSDVLKNLLAAYQDDLEIMIQDEQDLSFIKSFYLIPQPEILPPDFSTPLPCLLVYPFPTPTPLLCVSAYAYQKDYQIGLTLIQEHFGDPSFGLIGRTGNNGIIDNLSDIEDRYHSQTFEITNSCYSLSIDYQSRRIPPFMHDGIIQGTLTLQHIYEDIKGATMNPSYISIYHLYLDTDDTIPVRYSTIRIEGNGGDVTLTNTPSIANGLYDGQRIRIVGYNDSALITLQDEVNLPGSTFHFQNARDVILGLNDNITVEWDASQGLWAPCNLPVDTY